MDMKVENGKLSEYRTRVMLSFNYEGGVGPAVTGRDIIGGFQCGEQIFWAHYPLPFSHLVYYAAADLLLHSVPLARNRSNPER